MHSAISYVWGILWQSVPPQSKCGTPPSSLCCLPQTTLNLSPCSLVRCGQFCGTGSTQHLGFVCLLHDLLRGPSSHNCPSLPIQQQLIHLQSLAKWLVLPQLKHPSFLVLFPVGQFLAMWPSSLQLWQVISRSPRPVPPTRSVSPPEYRWCN